MAKQQTNLRRENISALEGPASPTTATPAAGHKFMSKAERRGSPQPVGEPRRRIYDCMAARYRQLKLASMNTGSSMNAIIFSAVDDWLAAYLDALEI